MSTDCLNVKTRDIREEVPLNIPLNSYPDKGEVSLRAIVTKARAG